MSFYRDNGNGKLPKNTKEKFYYTTLKQSLLFPQKSISLSIERFQLSTYAAENTTKHYVSR